MHWLRRVFGLDLRSIALFRILLGTLLLSDLILRAADISAFYTDQGVLARKHLLDFSNKFYWTLHAASGELWWQVLLFCVAGLAAFALLIGYRSKIAALVSFVLLASLLNRNGLILQGGDQLLVIMCFWSLFLPLSARYSVDAALEPRFKESPNDTESVLLNSDTYFSIATIAIVFQVLYLYIFTAILKTGDAWVVRHDAAFYAVSLQQFATPIGNWIKQFPEFLQVGTVYVLAVEYIAPLLVLCPFFWPWMRSIGILLLASLHVAFLLMLHIGLFPLIDFMSLSLLIPGALWAMFSNRRSQSADTQRRQAIQMYYDEDCGFCLKMCLLLRMMLLSPGNQILPAQQHPDIYPIMEKNNSWVVTDADNNHYIHWHAMAFLFKSRWPFKPLGWLMSCPPFIQLGNALYRLIAKKRGFMGTLFAKCLPYKSVRIKPTLSGSVIAAFFFYIVTSYNVYGLPQVVKARPAHVNNVARSLRIDQHWNMFAPYPLTNSLYVLIPGKLRNGQSVNLYPQTSFESKWTPPERFYSLYDGYRWRKYYGRLNSHRNNAVRRSYGTYLCQSWNNQKRDYQTQLATLEIHVVKLRRENR